MNQCKCPHGAPRDGNTGCWKDGGVNCLSCGQGYHLVKLRFGQMLSSSASSFVQTFGRETIVQDARALEEVEQPDSVAEMFSTLEALATTKKDEDQQIQPTTALHEGMRYQCVRNICRCPRGGKSATGPLCPKHGMVICRKCFNTHILYPDRRCRKIFCQCQNGTPCDSGCTINLLFGGFVVV